MAPTETRDNWLIDALIARHANSTAPFLISPEGNITTYADFYQRVLNMASWLKGKGVKAGDKVLAQTSKRPETLALYLATVAAGGVFVPLNIAYTPAELDYFIGDAEPVLFMVDETTQSASVIAEARKVQWATLDEAGKAPTSSFQPVARGNEDLAAILYTSGTTGRSKGAMLTHENLLSNALTLVKTWRYTQDDVLLHALPIFHTHGLFVASNVTLAAGSSMLFLPAFNLDEMARLLPQASTIMGVPTFYTRMLGDDRFSKASMAHMRLCVSGSAPLLDETHRAFHAQTDHAILERYGMTETNMITSNPYDGDRRPGTVGPPLPGVQVRLGNTDDKGIGGIEVRGPNVTPGYWRNEEKTAESFTEDGYFITGDLGSISDDGYISIVGRQKDLVISGGYNIYPKEVEIEIDSLPGVVESAVYGVPHADLGEAVAAAVVVEPNAVVTPDTVTNALKDRLARFKQPRHVTVVDALPRNTMGKVQKNVLRQQQTQGG